MNRSARFLLVCCLLLAVWPLLAARPVQQETRAVIDEPRPNATVRGLVTVRGSADIGNFQFYKVEWGRGADPDEWHLIGSTYPTPVRDGVLVQWDTTTLPDGVYSLRLHVVKMDGNFAEYIVPQIIVTNKRPTETPTLTPTPEETRGPTPTAGPTATLAILQPTAALAQPSPTPTPVRPSPRDVLPQLPLTTWREALCTGIVAMASISAVLGVVFALRRLL